MLLVELEESSDSDVEVVVVVMDDDLLSLEPEELEEVDEYCIRVTSSRKRVYEIEQNGEEGCEYDG